MLRLPMWVAFVVLETFMLSILVLFGSLSHTPAILSGRFDDVESGLFGDHEN